jgi:uncharacterized protein (DUF433 family)
MNTATQYPHLAFDPDGTARIERSRYKVLHLAGAHYHYGWTAEVMLRQQPDLRREQVYAALTYFYDRYDELVAMMHASADVAAAERLKQTLSLAELLKRRSVEKP